MLGSIALRNREKIRKVFGKTLKINANLALSLDLSVLPPS